MIDFSYVKPALTPPQQYRVKLETECTLCNTELDVLIKYVDHNLNDVNVENCTLVVEQAFCPNCEVRVRSRCAPVH